jgi:3-oxoacyl-[acyl-carrier protein] reductase
VISLVNRTALVTGGTGGLGRPICTALAEQGARVAVGYNSDLKGAEELVNTLAGDGHCAVHCPVTDSRALAQAAEAIGETFAKLDILVNSAGITKFVPHQELRQLDDALIDSILAVNVRGVIATTRAMEGVLRRAGRATIVNISSIAGTSAMGSNIAYCASKAAVDNLTKSLARALAPAIRVVSVAPGLVETGFVRAADPSWVAAQTAQTPLGRLASPQDVAAAVLVSISGLCFTTGSVIHVDGGRLL